MPPQKSGLTRDDLKSFKEEIIHQFHVASEGVIDQVKLVAEGVTIANEKLDRIHQESKTEIQETRQEVLAAVKFSYAELDKRLPPSRKNFLNLDSALKK
ncbi:MAG: hypothetical protein ACXVB1_16770 [Pseudobdellovibrionaceae bacterium]